MTTLNQLIEKLQNLAASNHYAGEMQVAGMVGSSGTAYEIGSTYVVDANEETADMLGLREGDAHVQIYLGN